MIESGISLRSPAANRLAILSVALLHLGACGSDSNEAPPRTLRATVTTLAAANFPPDESSLPARAISITIAGPLGANPGAIFEAFQNDLAACSRLVEVMRADSMLATRIEQAITGKGASVDTVLRDSPHADKKEIRHLLENAELLRIGQSMEGETYAAAALVERGIYCAPMQARLEAIERLGPSADGWKIREYFLTGALRALRMPWEQQGNEAGNFERLRDDIESAARLYRTAERAALETWLASAISHLTREQVLADSAQGNENSATRDQALLSAWIATLESIRSIRTSLRASANPVDADGAAGREASGR